MFVMPAMLWSFFYVLLLSLQWPLIRAIAIPQQVATAGAVSTIFQFGRETWIENLAVRPNNKILITTVNPSPDVWEIDPAAKNGSAELITTFGNASAALGITELTPDVYAVISGTLVAATATSGVTGDPGSFALWKIDMRESPPSVAHVVTVASSQLFNGLTTLSAIDETVLAGDVLQGVYRINMRTGDYSLVLQDETMLAGPNGTRIGINGMRHVGKYLYYDNTNKGIFCRVALNPDGTAAGPFEVISTYEYEDDMTVLPSGRAFIAGNVHNEIYEVQPNGSYEIFAGSPNSTEVAGCTSMQFGRDVLSNTLYVTTNGAQAAPVNGTYVEPGKVVAIQVENLY